MLRFVQSHRIEIVLIVLLVLVFLLIKGFFPVPFFSTYAADSSPYSDDCPKCCLGGETPRVVANGDETIVLTCDGEVGVACNGTCEEIPPYSEWEFLIK
jgi:hypothetical protein